MRTVSIAILCISALPVLFGCPGPPRAVRRVPADAPGAPVAGWPRSFVDDLGVEVTLSAPPMRIVSLAPGFTETLFAIGAGDRVVGRTDFCDAPPAALEIESVGGLVTPSIEKIVSLEPDLVLVIRGTPADVVDALRRAGLPVIARDMHTLSDVLAGIRDVGRYLGMESEADALGDELEARRAAVVQQTESLFAARARPEVLLLVSIKPIFAAGEQSFAGDIIALAGGENAAGGPELADAGPWPQLGLEAIIDRDPDILVLAWEHHHAGEALSADELAETPGWRELSAVRNGQVYEVDPDPLSRAGPRVVDALEQLARIIATWARRDAGDA